MSDLSEQQERFCRFIVEGMNQRDAYKAAGYKSSSPEAQDANASRLIGSDKIAARIADLKKPITEKTEITLEWLQEQAKGLLEEARTAKAFAAATGALKELGILTGHRVEVRDNLNLNRDANDTSELSRKELLDIARAGRTGTPAKANGAGNPDRVH